MVTRLVEAADLVAQAMTPDSGTRKSVAPARADRIDRRAAAAREGFLGAVADALNQNLARGYLEGEERIRQIAEALHDVISLSDAKGTELYFVNAAYEQIWGRPREELYANPLALLDGVHPEDRERVRLAMTGGDGESYNIEFRVVRPTGEHRWVWTRGFPVRDANGESYRIAAITEDVTERKQIVESHDRLIRGFTHDVKNPLGAADGYLALLQEGAFGGMSHEQLQSVDRARRSIRAALDLVSGLLDIERAEAGRLRLQREPVDLVAVTTELVDEFRATADAKCIGIATEIREETEGTLVAQSDPARIRQILANLLSNAVKYTQGGGRIAVEARVALDGERPSPGRWAAVSVADNGPGIPREKQSLVFREFTRFDPGAASGSGIGLAISRRLARALGGDITFASVPGMGSSFTLWLPLAAPGDAERPLTAGEGVAD